MQSVVPALRVSSYATSKVFYEKLGFAQEWTHQFGQGFPVFASIAREGMRIFLTEHTGDCAFGGLVHFYVDDVDQCHAAFVGAGIEIAEPPNHGLGPDIRTMLVIDPDKNRLSFITLVET